MKDSERLHFLEVFHSIDFHRIKDHPNILIAANFWDEERFCAARVCYKFMRAIDDLIDDHKAGNVTIKPGERDNFSIDVEKWLHTFTVSEDCHPFGNELKETIRTFRIPSWPMEAFARAMIYDIHHDGFSTLESFLDYTAGASVAPAAIFVHLLGLTKNGEGYDSPAFDVRAVATPCAVFSYLVHIIRDFQKDQLSNLTYFADDQIEKYGLNRQLLREFAEGKPVSDGFRDMIGEYLRLADIYRSKTLDAMQAVFPLLEPRYRLSLEIIFQLYLLVYEKIDLANGRFTTAELTPLPEETRERVYRTIRDFNF